MMCMFCSLSSFLARPSDMKGSLQALILHRFPSFSIEGNGKHLTSSWLTRNSVLTFCPLYMHKTQLCLVMSWDFSQV